MRPCVHVTLSEQNVAVTQCSWVSRMLQVLVMQQTCLAGCMQADQFRLYAGHIITTHHTRTTSQTAAGAYTRQPDHAGLSMLVGHVM